MTRAKRLEKLERAVQAQKTELMVAATVAAEFCTALIHCEKVLDPATYKRVETVLRSCVEEAHPWLA